MEVKTQICTTVEQSKRLISLGLSKSTADMWLTNAVIAYMPTAMVLCGDKYTATENKLCSTDIPAWSLHRLEALCPEVIDTPYSLHKTLAHGSIFYCDMNYKEDREISFSSQVHLYDNIIDCIEWLIKEKYFDEKYLNK